MPEYHIAPLSEFPLGTIVFYCDTKTYNNNITGITHVGIVVGNKLGSPEIAHAATGKNVKHVVVSRLPECTRNFGYIKVQLPDEFNKDFIVALAHSMATHSKDEKAIIKYSQKRSDFMKNKLFEQFKMNIDKGVKDPYTRTIFDNIDSSNKSFTEKNESAGWFTPLAKSLNFASSDFVYSMNKQKLNNGLIGILSKKDQPKFSKYKFSSKGYHCVQFVVMVMQMSFLLTENELVNYFSLENIDKERIYFSRKKKEKLIDSFKSTHPKKVILNECVGGLKSLFCGKVIDVDGVSLSPAAFLRMFYKGFGGIPGHGGANGFMMSSTFGLVEFSELKSNVASLKRQIKEVDFTDRATFSKRFKTKVNSLIELFSVLKVLQYLEQQKIRLEIERRIMPLVARNISAATLANRVRVRDRQSNSEPAPKRARR